MWSAHGIKPDRSWHRLRQESPPPPRKFRLSSPESACRASCDRIAWVRTRYGERSSGEPSQVRRWPGRVRRYPSASSSRRAVPRQAWAVWRRRTQRRPPCGRPLGESAARDLGLNGPVICHVARDEVRACARRVIPLPPCRPSTGGEPSIVLALVLRRVRLTGPRRRSGTDLIVPALVPSFTAPVFGARPDRGNGQHLPANDALHRSGQILEHRRRRGAG